MKSLSSQVTVLFTVVAAAYLPAILLLTLVAIISSQTGISVSTFTRDAVAAVSAPFYTGAVSQVGLLLWSATAAMCLLLGIAGCCAYWANPCWRTLVTSDSEPAGVVEDFA